LDGDDAAGAASEAVGVAGLFASKPLVLDGKCRRQSLIGGNLRLLSGGGVRSGGLGGSRSLGGSGGGLDDGRLLPDDGLRGLNGLLGGNGGSSIKKHRQCTRLTLGIQL